VNDDLEITLNKESRIRLTLCPIKRLLDYYEEPVRILACGQDSNPEAPVYEQES
jgi:hypothetical protein